jgi:hypothetical protein
MFGVNFADGRIKGYPIGRVSERGEKTYYVLYVRGGAGYGRNDFVDNGDGTVTDRATGLTWMQVDSGHLRAGRSGDGRLDWSEALAWAENLQYAGHDDWRLPNVKELQSIVDYSRCPEKTGSPAIDPIFRTTRITVEEGRKDWPVFWSSTTHAQRDSARQAAYVAFGRALGYMRDRRTGRTTLMDVHGAGAQRSDPKSGDPSTLPKGHGPQGDVQRIYNFARCVRGGSATPRRSGPAVEMTREKVRPARRPSGGTGGGSDGLAGQRQPGGGGGEGWSERRSGRARGSGRFVRRLDRDGDGKVSRREFDGPAAGFQRFDRNGDGYISADEAPTGPPPGPPARR